MTKQEQTKEVLIRLCNLTKTFVNAYWQKYYYQYRGDLYDLAMEFYCEFLTPKARGNKPKETLLDKYDSSITSLEYLVKVSVIRKLIDRSRADYIQMLSIDKVIEEYGDSMSESFSLYTNDLPEETVDSKFFQRRVRKAFLELDDLQRNTIFAKLYDSGSPLCKFLRPHFQFINDCPVQQITDRTVVLFVPSAHRCVNFSILDGHAKGAIKPFILPVRDYQKYHSGFERELFEEYNEKCYASSYK